MLTARTFLQLHSSKALLIFFVINIQLIANLLDGEIQQWPLIHWLDILGEGSAVMLSVAWLAMILCSRPTGRITNLLAIGLTFICIAMFQDVLDEVVILPEESIWGNWVESGSMPIGLVFLTIGMFAWHKEQLALNSQLMRRERLFRDHDLLDPVTGVSQAAYIRKQIDFELNRSDSLPQPLSVAMLDIDGFDLFNRRYGYTEGDRYLQELAELLMLNLRRSDLLCRYAGDRFVILMPATGEPIAEQLVRQLIDSGEHFAYKTTAGETVYQQLSYGLTSAVEGDAETILSRLHNNLLQRKDRKIRRIA